MYTIGKLARKTRVKADSIRFYERQGLIGPEAKTRSGYRLYTDAAVRRLLVIKNAQRCGFSLEEIGTLLRLPEATSGSVRAAYRMLVDKKHEIDKTIDTLRAMSSALTALLAARDADDVAKEALSPESIVLDALGSLDVSRAAKIIHSPSTISTVRLPVA